MVGHWLGLFHTFQGGCDKDNDLVLDTPPQRLNSYARRPLKAIYCKTDDAKKMELNRNQVNIMDYTENLHRFGLTPGQIQRMHLIWVLYRLHRKENA